MKSYKLLCLVGDSEYVQESLSTRVPEEVCKTIYYNEMPYIRVIEVRHENPEDNFVKLEDDMGGHFSFLRDINGKLFYVDEYWTKTDLINKFE